MDIVKHAINNESSLTAAKKLWYSPRSPPNSFAKKRTFHGNRLGQQLEILLIISFPSKRESDESLKITTKLHYDLARHGGVTLNQY